MFSGSKIYEIYNRLIKKIHSLHVLFPNGPINVKAAYYNIKNNTIVLFQNYKVFMFQYNLLKKKFNLKKDFPKRISTINIVGAMQWNNGRHFLFLVVLQTK